MLISINMKKHFKETVEIPEGVSCTFEDKIFSCSKGSLTSLRSLDIPGVQVKVDNKAITLESKKGNKNQYKIIKSYVAHINNLFSGLDENYVYKLEACNVHFPMTLKLEKDKLIINNFLGEKVPRFAYILPNVKIDISGTKITLSSHNKEAIGQTAANLEKATLVRSRDRRIFQDGIFLVEKLQGEQNA